MFYVSGTTTRTSSYLITYLTHVYRSVFQVEMELCGFRNARFHMVYRVVYFDNISYKLLQVVVGCFKVYMDSKNGLQYFY